MNLLENTTAKIILDSIGPSGQRLTTMEVRFPRYILPEFNTHRSFCLGGDSVISFDTDRAVQFSRRNNISYKLSDLYSLWMNSPEKVKALNIRNINENTGNLRWAKITEVSYSGFKPLYQLTTRLGKTIECTIDHQLFTRDGWIRLRDKNVCAIPGQTDVPCPPNINLGVLDNSMTLNYERLVKIKYLGSLPCFDIAVDSEYHNFIANSICVHNSRSSCSSRSIPTWKKLLEVMISPVIPQFEKNKSGMFSNTPLTEEEQEKAEVEWLKARDMALAQASVLAHRPYVGKAESDAWKTIDDYVKLKTPSLYQENCTYKVHKQWVNRLLEPYMWHTVIVTATDFENFFKLRCDKNTAQKEIYIAAQSMLKAYLNSTPQLLKAEDWHLPYVLPEDKNRPIEEQQIISVASCARVSYLNHLGSRDFNKDKELYDRLLADVHMSPFEAVAQATDSTNYSGNFKGWIQFRKTLPNECWTDISLEDLLEF